MTTRTVTGGCHCGAIAFTGRLDLSAPTIRCNCSICARTRNWVATLPKTDFNLDRGSDALADYRFGPRHLAHHFCRICGVRTHGRFLEDGADEMAVCIAALDLSPEDLAALDVIYVDGRNDDVSNPPALTSYL